MICNITAESLYSAGGLVFIVTGLIGAYVRWNHMCRPFDENPDYFYPARREVSVFYALLLLTFPYAMAPMDPSVLLYTRCFCVLFYPVCFAVLISKYFQLRKRQRRHPAAWYAYICSPFAILSAMLIQVITGRCGWMLEHQNTVLSAVGALSLLLTCVTAAVLLNLKRETDRFNMENYSNDEDFPYRFALRIIYLPVLWLALMWVIFVTGNRWIIFAADIATSCFMVYFLCLILHPQRVLRPAEINSELRILEEEKNLDILTIDTEGATEEEITEEEEDDTPMDVIREEVLAVVLRRFREPHLLKTEVLMELGNGKMNRASKFISSIGYYKLVNMFRLEYASLYKDAHPSAKQEEIAIESGFVSRTAYYKAKRDVGEIDRQLTKGVTLSEKRRYS